MNSASTVISLFCSETGSLREQAFCWASYLAGSKRALDGGSAGDALTRISKVFGSTHLPFSALLDLLDEAFKCLYIRRPPFHYDGPTRLPPLTKTLSKVHPTLEVGLCLFEFDRTESSSLPSPTMIRTDQSGRQAHTL